jgi:predicted DsbA family dithiol-disulfide isomerase
MGHRALAPLCSVTGACFIVLAAYALLTPPSGDVGAQDAAAGDAELIQRADAARTWGTAEDRPTIDEFVDMACSDCADFHVQRGDSLMSMLVENGRANYVLRVYPIPRLLRGYHAAEALFTAGAIGGRRALTGMLNLLLFEQHTWSDLLDPRDRFVSFAERLGLDAERFAALLDRDALAPLIASDFVRGQALGVNGTPTFVFNRPGAYEGAVKFYGNQPLVLFETHLERVGGDRRP